ncbi:MAG: ATP-binding protein [Achromobacter sp.]|uniref:ATP-binding protein n=1 Tax=Achromobacter sp. TaxID=134375 RepID=UPI003CFC49DC
MTLQRRLILAVLLAVPLGWVLTIAVTYWRAQHEINELYDTDMLRLAEQTLAVASLLPPSAALAAPRLTRAPDAGDASHGDLAVAIWLGPDEPLVLDIEARQFPRADGQQGFIDSMVSGAPWRLYYLSDGAGATRVAVGQRVGERDDLVVAYLTSQLVPWLVGLPVLMAVLVVAVRRAIQPLRDLSRTLERRRPDDGSPLPQDAPGELKPLVAAMNGLLARAGRLIEQERRLTADAAHELRTPLAALRAQWEVVQRATDPALRAEAQTRVMRGLERMDRLVTQLLTMARLDSVGEVAFASEVDWRAVAEQAIGDCLWIANRRDVDIDVEWPAPGQMPLPVAGDADALAILLKNLLDNAIRYGPRHGRVRITFAPARILVDDEGAGLAPEIAARLGDRFLRGAGNEESGSGLGVSIARRIARNHGLALRYEMRAAAAGRPAGLRAILARAAPGEG